MEGGNSACSMIGYRLYEVFILKHHAVKVRKEEAPQVSPIEGLYFFVAASGMLSGNFPEP